MSARDIRGGMRPSSALSGFARLRGPVRLLAELAPILLAKAAAAALLWWLMFGAQR